jgi:hypothetical protein
VTPNNASYLYAAYAAAGVLYVGYAIALWRRRARLRRAARALEHAEASAGGNPRERAG